VCPHELKGATPNGHTFWVKSFRRHELVISGD